IPQDRQPAQTDDDLAQQLESLGSGLGRLQRQSGDVAARPRQAGDEAAADWIIGGGENDRDDRCRLLQRIGGPARADDHIDLEADELGSDLSVTLVAPLSPSILDRDRASLAPAEFAQPLHERGGPAAPGRRRTRAEKADGRQLCRLLRSRRERPGRRAAKQRDELAPLHSITSSARASRDGGTVRPSASAVLRLMTSSYLFGA